MTTKCKRVHSHVYSTALNGSISWPWSGAMLNEVRAWGSQFLRLTFRPRRMADETRVTYKIRPSRFMGICWRKMGLPLLSHKIARKIWTTMTWAVYDGDVTVMLALRSLFGCGERLHGSSWGMAWDPNNVQRWKHKVGFHNRGVQWDTPMARWAGEGNDWTELLTQTRPHKEDVIQNLLESMKQPFDKKKVSKGPAPSKKPRGLPPLDLAILVPGEQLTLEIQGDNKTSADWMNGHTKMKTRIGTVEKVQNLLREWWGHGERFRQRASRPLGGQTRARRGVWRNGWTLPDLRGEKLPVSVDFGTEAATTAVVGTAL